MSNRSIDDLIGISHTVAEQFHILGPAAINLECFFVDSQT